MHVPKRTRYALLLFLALVCFLLATVQGPILIDGVAFYAPIMLFAFLVWRLVVYRKNRSRSYMFLAGAVGGLFGTIVWPTGILMWMMLTGNVDHLETPLAILFAIFFVACLVGGTVAMLLSFGFEPSATPTTALADQTETPSDLISLENAV